MKRSSALMLLVPKLITLKGYNSIVSLKEGYNNYAVVSLWFPLKSDTYIDV